jgi:multiple sugar transport system substrate-binding protein
MVQENERTAYGRRRREFSRREVLKGFAAGAVGLGATQITGCGLFTAESGGEDEIELWHWETPPHRVEAYRKLFNRFSEETGIKLNQVAINGPEFATKVQSAAESNTLPELIFANPPEMMLLVPDDLAIPLDDVFKDIHQKVQFFEKAHSIYNLNGAQWGIPLFGVSWPLTYRADLHEAAGFDGPPESWDDLLVRAEKMHGDLPGYYQPVSTNGNYGNQSIWGYLRVNGAKIVAPSPDGEKVVFNSKETIETYEFLKQLSQFTGKGASNADWPSTELLIRGGEVQTLVYTGSPLGDLVTKNNNKELAKKYAMALLPRPGASGPIYNTGYARAALVTKAAEERGKVDAAKEWLRWISKPENNAEMLLANLCLFMPVSEAANEAETWTQNPFNREFNNLIEVQTEAMRHISVQGFEEGAESPNAAAIEGSRLTAAVLQKIVLDNQPVDEAVAWGHAEYEKLVNSG